MRIIKIIEDTSSDEFLTFLADNLSKKYKVIISCKNKFPWSVPNPHDVLPYQNKSESVVILEFSDRLSNVNKSDTVVFFKNFRINTAISKLDKSTSIICSSDDIHLLKPIAKFSPTVYTCGYGDKNHISISSLRDHDASISLIRAIITSQGNTIQPAEYVLNNTNTLTSHEILGATLIFLLFGIL